MRFKPRTRLKSKAFKSAYSLAVKILALELRQYWWAYPSITNAHPTDSSDLDPSVKTVLKFGYDSAAHENVAGTQS